MIRVTIWNEFVHEQVEERVKEVYPKGIHGAISEFLSKNEDMEVRTGTLSDPEQGLPDEVLNNTDVLIWWGHMAHDKVDDALVERIHKRVLDGMGFIGLHSAHHSKIFKKLMGTTCNLRWRLDGMHERVWNIAPNHPIAQGIPPYFEVEKDEMYGELFDIPQPDEQIFLTWHPGGELFRSGCTFKRGLGRIFYFQPGHEEYPIFSENKYVQKIITNAVRWVNPYVIDGSLTACLNPPSTEKEYLEKKNQ